MSVETSNQPEKKEHHSPKDIPRKKIAIIGLPNTGKSQVYNFLTGKYALVANYPLTTISIERTRCIIDDQTYEVIDTPGLHSLYIHSQEEKVVRDLLFSECPDILIQCIDANQLRQSLALTRDLMALNIPMVLCLNAVAETAKAGLQIDAAKLSEYLKVPVIELFSLQDKGKEKIKAGIRKARTIGYTHQLPESIEKSIAALYTAFPYSLAYKRKKAILLLEDDPFISQFLQKEIGESQAQKMKHHAERLRQHFSGDLGRVLNQKQDLWADAVYDKVSKQQPKKSGKVLDSFSHLSRHPVFGIPILVGIVVIIYYMVVHVAGLLDSLLSFVLLDPVLDYINKSVTSGFWNDFLVGDYGILTLGFFNAIVTVLPILSVFFLVFGVLEDIGYIPNLCVLVHRILGKIGITGKSILSLILGFGCKTMATLTTRGLQSRKEKYIAIYLIAFAIPCSPQLGLSMAILGKIGITAFLIAFGTLIAVEIGAGLVLNRIIKDDRPSDFIQVLPPIRIPNILAILKKTYYRLIWFLKEAVPIFILAAAVLFLFDKSGGLDGLKTLASPLVTGWLGFPIDMVDAIILTIARHEAAAGLILKMVGAGTLNYIQCIVAVVLTTMFVPCFANAVAMFREMGLKTGITMYVIINISTVILAGILNWLLVFTLGG